MLGKIHMYVAGKKFLLNEWRLEVGGGSGGVK
jgi:hypothetical protein